MSATKLELRTALGPVYQDVLPNPPRDYAPEEIPALDLTPMFSEALSERHKVASQIRRATVNNGFFYVKNHGIPAEMIALCKQQVLNFMRQPQAQKGLLDSRKHSKYDNGYQGHRKTQISPSERVDVREAFSFRYSPELDLDHPMKISQIPEKVRPWIRGEGFVRLLRMFALSLEPAEDYWDDKVAYPGADGVFYYYSPRNKEETEKDSVGLGSHTDLQLFTLLWRDHVGGLPILTKAGQWIKLSGLLLVESLA
ncbi:hypothetical protein DL765_009055 [Monosporascus sp. GIB2]|nr:hypothetical protein DL765_009055 [Monosporascus sp. GIB2]